VLAGQVESGLLSAELTEIELVPGTGNTPITAGLLSAIVPEFGQLDPDTPLKLKIEPTLAPALPGTIGPNGELAELIVSHLLVKVQTINGATTYATIAADLMAGFDITVEPGTGNLLPVLTAPDANDIAITLLRQPARSRRGDVAGGHPRSACAAHSLLERLAWSDSASRVPRPASQRGGRDPHGSVHRSVPQRGLMTAAPGDEL
jgi:hypothetical protein